MDYKNIIEEKKEKVSSAIIDLNSCLGLNVKGRKIKTYLPSLNRAMQEMDSILEEDKLKRNTFSYKLKSLFTNANETLDKDIDYKFTRLIESSSVRKALSCTSCACSKCIIECPFKSCLDCESKIVKYCDQKRMCITVPTDIKLLSLRNEDRGRNEMYEVICYAKDLENDDGYTYLYMRNKADKDDEQIIKYTKFLNGTEDYKPISEKELDFIYDLCLDNKII